MSLDDYNELLDQVSPKYYRQFRLLYNELLGYIERNETDKIAEFSTRIHQKLGHALQLQKKLQQRLNNMHKQQKVVQKEALKYAFLNPKKTIPYDPMFPLKYPIIAEEPEPESVPSTLEKDRKIDQLLSEMEHFDQSKHVDKLMTGVADPENELATSLDDAPITGPSTQLGDYMPDVSDDTSEGTSIDDDLTDERLKIKKQQDRDVERSKKVITQNDAPASDKMIEKTPPKASNNDRKGRIWDYIDDDQKKGNINDSR